jgi:hypothetical protein
VVNSGSGVEEDVVAATYGVVELDVVTGTDDDYCMLLLA